MAYIITEPIPCFCTSREACGVKLRDHNTVKQQMKLVQSIWQPRPVYFISSPALLGSSQSKVAMLDNVIYLLVSCSLLLEENIASYFPFIGLVTSF
jgi:hypothetical protein